MFYELRLGRPVLRGVVSPERSWSANASRLRNFPFPKIKPREFDWAARQACAPERRDRSQSVDAFLKDLRSIQNGSIVSAGAKSPCYLTTRFLKKYRNFLTLITLVALLLVSVTGLSLSMAARDRKANLALGRDDAVEALAIVDLALDLNSENGEARYFKTFLLATRTFAKPEESPEVAFEISGIEPHTNGFRVVSASGESAVIAVPKTKLRHPLADIQFHDEHGLVTFASKATGKSLISPILYRSGSGIFYFSSDSGRLAAYTKARKTSVMISTMARDRDIITIVDSAGAIGIRNDDGDLEFLAGPLVPVKRISLSADGGIGAPLLETGELAVFSPNTKDYLNRWKPEGSPRCLALSDDGQTLIVGMENGDIHLFNPGTGREIREKIITGAVSLELAVIPGRQEFLTRSDGDLHLRRWDFQTGNLLHSGLRHKDGVLWFSCSIDGKFLFSIDQKEIDPTRGFLRIWSLRSGQEIVPALAHDAPLNCATIYENGRRIATAADDGTVRRWTIAEE